MSASFWEVIWSIGAVAALIYAADYWRRNSRWYDRHGWFACLVAGVFLFVLSWVGLGIAVVDILYEARHPDLSVRHLPERFWSRPVMRRCSRSLWMFITVLLIISLIDSHSHRLIMAILLAVVIVVPLSWPHTLNRWRRWRNRRV